MNNGWVSINLFSSDVFQDLLGIPQLDPSQSFESLNEEEKEAIAGSTRGPSSVPALHAQEDSLQQSSTPSRSLLPEVGRSPEISSYFDDMALTNVSFSSLFKAMKWFYNQVMEFLDTVFYVIFQTWVRVRVFYGVFQTRENWWRPRAFIVFECLENPGKTRSTSFWNGFSIGA